MVLSAMPIRRTETWFHTGTADKTLTVVHGDAICAGGLTRQSSRHFAAGRLLFVRENTLVALPFDAASGQALGEVFPVAEGVSLIATMRRSLRRTPECCYITAAVALMNGSRLKLLQVIDHWRPGVVGGINPISSSGGSPSNLAGFTLYMRSSSR